eukprot:scaffold15524_cov149-Isochrysis_galbana.AAC.1
MWTPGCTLYLYRAQLSPRVSAFTIPNGGQLTSATGHGARTRTRQTTEDTPIKALMMSRTVIVAFRQQD